MATGITLKAPDSVPIQIPYPGDSEHKRKIRFGVLRSNVIQTRQPGSADALPVAACEVEAMTNAVTAPVQGSASDGIALPSSCTVRDSVALKAQLLPLFDREVVAINLHAVERIDTAVLQLLVAFVRDRGDAGRATQWIGLTDCINEAVGILGLSERLQLPLYDAVA